MAFPRSEPVFVTENAPRAHWSKTILHKFRNRNSPIAKPVASTSSRAACASNSLPCKPGTTVKPCGQIPCICTQTPQQHDATAAKRKQAAPEPPPKRAKLDLESQYPKASTNMARPLPPPVIHRLLCTRCSKRREKCITLVRGEPCKKCARTKAEQPGMRKTCSNALPKTCQQCRWSREPCVATAGEPCKPCLQAQRPCSLRSAVCKSCVAVDARACSYQWGTPCGPCAAQGTPCSVERLWDVLSVRVFTSRPDPTFGHAWDAAGDAMRYGSTRAVREGARKVLRKVGELEEALRAEESKAAEISAAAPATMPNPPAPPHPTPGPRSLIPGPPSVAGSLHTRASSYSGPPTSGPLLHLPPLLHAGPSSSVIPTPANKEPVIEASRLPPTNQSRASPPLSDLPPPITSDQNGSSDEEPLQRRYSRTLPSPTPRTGKAKGKARAITGTTAEQSNPEVISPAARPSTSKAASLPPLSSEPEFSSPSDADDTDWDSDTGSDSDYFLPSDGGSVSTATPPRRRKRRRATQVRHAASSATSASSVRAGAGDADFSSPSSNQKAPKPTPRIRKTPQHVKMRQPTSAASPPSAFNANADDTHSSVSSVVRSTSNVTPLKRRAPRATTAQEHTPSACSAQTPGTTRRLPPQQSPWTRARPPWQDPAGTPLSLNALSSSHPQVLPESDDDAADEREVLRILFPEPPRSGAHSRWSPPAGAPAR
ncbi:hypothetical protein PsYK624_137460 [Phanerochaete sordida]|uniref:Uncharacterized protein n=1 Tax=Phanerochaete sordida TaxID=48140 RepID=A0A9P3LJM5_9APHY|nr:hypothetical protein PsYK624_137460 [Phanerochaete sordida]